MGLNHITHGFGQQKVPLHLALIKEARSPPPKLRVTISRVEHHFADPGPKMAREHRQRIRMPQARQSNAVEMSGRGHACSTDTG